MNEAERRRRIDALRRHFRLSAAGELGNAAIDGFLAGTVDRRALLRYASIMGFSALTGLPDLAGASPASLSSNPAAADAAAPAAASSAASPDASHGAPRAPTNDVIRVANLTPVASIDPLTASDPATICLLSQTCEYLIDDDGDALVLRPSLATHWSPDATGQVWTFTLRREVRFHDGTLLTAADVVATFDRLTDPHVGSAALAAFRGVLSKGGTRAIDEHTVAFHLDGPNGNFPYYVSSDNYNAAILPASQAADTARRYETTFIGTGPFRLEKYTPRLGATFVRNESYWGEKALPARVVFGFYADQQSQILALQGRDADIVVNFAIQGGRALLNPSRYRVLGVRSSSHRQVHMRCDTGPFADRRIRQALALAIDRQAIVKGLFLSRAQRGNDNPFAPVFPAAPRALPQRDVDLPKARALLAAARGENGVRVDHDAATRTDAPTTLATEKFMELPDYAVLVQNAAKSIGVDLALRVESQSAYYGAAVPGRSDWLDSTIGITDYGHRGVPNVFLNATLASAGAWNAARFRNARYDTLIAQYGAALELTAQQRLATEIGQLLLDETPVIIAYFFDALLATRADLHGVRFTAITQLSLARAWIAGHHE